MINKIKVYFVCSGLGNVNRGYESFTRECFDTLKSESKLKCYLYKGGGTSQAIEKPLWNLPRFERAAILLGKIFKKEPYFIEQFTFFISLIPYLIFGKPQVILVSDFNLSTFLWHLRKYLGLKYKILFSNGAPNGPPFNRCDHVHQLLPIHFEAAIKGGTSKEMQSVIPYGIMMQDLKQSYDKELLKRNLKIPTNSFVILCVGAVNKSHKRIDYLISEFKSLKISDKYLIVLGQFDKETNEILELAQKNLRSDEYFISSVTQSQVKDYYLVSDIFILPSLSEGLPRVMIEAMSNGLEVLAHDYPVTQQVLEGFGKLGDFRVEGTLKTMLEEYYSKFKNQELSNDVRKYTLNRYSWQSIKNDYIKMIEKTFANNA
jgi:glycosyltransferase involved in cell wall biosynthesis